MNTHRIHVIFLFYLFLFSYEEPLWAQHSTSSHPTFPLLDEQGKSVLETKKPVSSVKTCGGCHDTSYILKHAYHSNAGIDELNSSRVKAHSWDMGPGLFGRWNPITYRYLDPVENSQFDLGTADWIRTLGFRHPGGGPATSSRSGIPLQELQTNATLPNPETHILNTQTGAITKWNWKKSGVVEMNCFLCHLSNPNNSARLQALHQGQFQLATTFTLKGTPLLKFTEHSWQWNLDAFESNGHFRKGTLTIQDPQIQNCGICHGLTASGESPVLVEPSLLLWETETKGQIFSSQRISESGMNLSRKETLSRPWDIHAERLLQCVDCHYSLNNPAYFKETSKPQHLKYDARKLSFGEYLWTPNHQFVKGQSVSEHTADHLDHSMRRCEDCHDISSHQQWLPYTDHHLQVLSCEACHIPKIHTFARQSTDWTVLTPQKEPMIRYRGIEGPIKSSASLISGYEPILLPGPDTEGKTKLYPYNLVTSWYWVAGHPEQPIRKMDLDRAFFKGEQYDPSIMEVLDENKNQKLEASEIVLNTLQKVQVVQKKLEGIGLREPKIHSEIQPYSLHHNVAPAKEALKDCATCHSSKSRLGQKFLLSDRVPGHQIPLLVGDVPVQMKGTSIREGNFLYFELDTQKSGYYVPGYDRWETGNSLGFWLIITILLGVTVHSLLRLKTQRSMKSL